MPRDLQRLDLQCLILAGGLATRMRPLTETIPKAMIPAEGKPFVDHQLTWLAAHGVTDAILSIGYLGGAIRDHVGDGARFGLRVRYVDEGTKLRGTAGAVRLALDEGVLEPRFLITYGDSFLPVDFAGVARVHAASGAPALMTVFHNEGRWDTSNVVLDRHPGGDRVALYDKQRRTRPPQDFQFIDYGLSAFERRVIAEEVPAGATADLADLFHRLSLRGELAGLEVQERFYEIGSPAGLEDFGAWLRGRG
ncbi:MAG TPA: sugar phosphate nucleotidyltransferase [Polyangia bacterium]|nr:sugar phosphate nucleotidyltransferase [Polyangia bacterium]